MTILKQTTFENLIDGFASKKATEFKSKWE